MNPADVVVLLAVIVIAAYSIVIVLALYIAV